jgi:hypothetical protein
LLPPPCSGSGYVPPGGCWNPLWHTRRRGGCATGLEVKRTALCVPFDCLILKFAKCRITRAFVWNLMLFQWAVLPTYLLTYLLAYLFTSLLTSLLTYFFTCLLLYLLLYLLPYLLPSYSRVLLEKLTGLQPVKKFPAYYVTRRFITAFTSARHLSVSWVSSIQSIPPHPIFRRSILILSTHLRLGFPSLLWNGYRVSFPGVKRPGRGVDNPPHLAPRLKKEYSYTSNPNLSLHGLLQGELYL